MYPQYQGQIWAVSCVLCTWILDYWNWTLTVEDDVVQEQKDTSEQKIPSKRILLTTY